jgi:hypothetical protein
MTPSYKTLYDHVKALCLAGSPVAVDTVGTAEWIGVITDFGPDSLYLDDRVLIPFHAIVTIIPQKGDHSAGESPS